MFNLKTDANEDDDCIIEIGSDGTFEIPSPKKKVKNQNVVQIRQKVIADELISHPLLASMNQGEWKVYKNTSRGTTNIVVHLFESEVVSSISTSETLLTIQTNNNDIRIPLTHRIQPSDVHAKVYNDFVSIEFRL